MRRQPLSTLKWALSCLLICFLALLNSCKKDDISQNEIPDLKSVAFLKIPPASPPAIMRIADKLRDLNSKNGFLIAISSQQGSPAWDKAIISLQRNSTSKTNRSITSTGDTIVYIPLIIPNKKQVNAFIYARLNGSIHLDIFNSSDYASYGFGSLNDTSNNAEKLATQFMILDNMVYGYTEFNILDNQLFKQSHAHEQNKSIHLDKINTTNSNRGNGVEFWEYDICTSYKYLDCYLNHACCPDGSCSGCQRYCWKDSEPECEKVTVTVFVMDNDPVDGGSGGSGGGGGGLGGAPTDAPIACNSTSSIDNGLPPCPIRNTDGWISINPYLFYLTDEERAALDKIAEEEREADLHNNNPEPCHGTFRMGYEYFHGNMEHWLIQLDYLSRYPLVSEREYSIPGASSNGSGNAGYADIVNTATKEIFEIKPSSQLASGITEVENYVLKANISCQFAGGNGIPWQKGTAANFGPPRFISWPRDPTKVLRASLGASGVITYDLLQSSQQPVAPPIAVPQSILDKIKNILTKLKNSGSNIEYELGVFFKKNPEVLQVIKGAAIGAAVVIIVGTIIEDILTAGAGIADDWACFMLAYRLIRVAQAL